MNLAIVIPGKDFTGNFLDSWTNFLVGCVVHKINFQYYRKYSPVIHEVRNLCMGANYNGGRFQVPFNGWAYDYILFIDSDMVFAFPDFKALLDDGREIVSGWYPLQFLNTKGERSMSVLSWNKAKTISDQFYTIDEIAGQKDNIFKVDTIGLGFVLIKKGVFEHINYPWFYPTLEEIDSINKKANGELDHTIREDIVWCEKATSLGFEIFVDKKLRIGHEKRWIL